MSRASWRRAAVGLAIVVLLGGAAAVGLRPSAEPAAAPDVASAWDAVVASEERIHDLGPSAAAVRDALHGRALSAAPIAEHLDVVDVVGEPARTPLETTGVVALAWEPGPTQRLRGADARVWAPVLDAVERFEHLEVAIVDGQPEGDAFVTRLAVRGAAVGRSGGRLGLRARVEARWTADPTSPTGHRLHTWRTLALETQEAAGPLYRDVLDTALPPGAAARARRSVQEELVAAELRGERTDRPEGFALESIERSPAVSVADIDGDGRDDVLVLPRYGPNLLLRATGPGRFEDVADAWGVADLQHAAAGLLADLDNDGDLDLFVARTGARSAYLVQHEGRFVDRTADLVEGGPLPALATSAAAADYDGDGLLDVYVATYGRPPPLGLVAPEVHAEVTRRNAQDSDSLTADLWGPPNVLLHNEGGGVLRVVADPGPVAVWRNTLQPSWSDVDADGDPDLYLANDFGPNQLFLNDGAGQFREATDALGLTSVGFSMGVAWGDYDGDGREDLYVSNMYSKAGRRVTGGLDGIDPRLARMASGNALYRAGPDGFERVSDPDGEHPAVAHAGWSWGSQFVDLDRDGDPDLVALSGHFTAPAEHAVAADW